jgi:hypothetical protein
MPFQYIQTFSSAVGPIEDHRRHASSAVSGL